MTTLNVSMPEEYNELTARLDAVGARFRLAACLRGLAWFLLVMVPVTVGILFLAGFLTLPEWLKMTLVGVWAVAIIGAYVAFMNRPLFRRPTYAEIARLVERHGEGRMGGDADRLDNSLINAVLLAQDFEAVSLAGAARGSSAWIPYVLREAHAATQKLPLESAVPWRQPRNAWLLAGLVLLVCAAGVGFAPAIFAHGLAVLMAPTKFVPHKGAVRILSVMPGNDTVLAGHSLSISVSVEAPEQRTIPATVEIHYASGKTVRESMFPVGSENSQYVRQGILAAEDMDYMITAGDTQSERYHIAVLPQINLTSFAADVVAPVYTGKAKQHLQLVGKDAIGKGALEAPLGSDVTLSVVLDGPAKEVLLDATGGTPIPMQIQADGRTFVASLRLREALRYTLRVNDGANRTLRQFPDNRGPGSEGEPDYFTLISLPDAPPIISVTDPARDVDAKPGEKIRLEAHGTDDYGLTQVRLEIAKNDEKGFRAIQSWPIAVEKTGQATRDATIRYTLDLPGGTAAEQYKLGDLLHYRFVAIDNRDLTGLDAALGSQSGASQIFTIAFSDSGAATAKSTKAWEDLRQKLSAILEHQLSLRAQAGALVAGLSVEEIKKTVTPISNGQKTIRTDIAALAKDFPFEPSMKLIQKALDVLAVEDASEAVDRGADILLLSDAKSLVPLATRLRQHQSRIIDVLQALLAIASSNQERLARGPDHEGADLPAAAKDAWKKLADELKDFEKQQKAVIDATASLAKKPKDEFNADDQQKVKELSAVEDKWEKFLNDRLADMSKLAQQDQANASLLEELVQMKVELATAKNALDQKAVEIATPLEENGLENAKELTTHIERWLQQQPDRQAWQMEEPVTQNDPKMAELPKQLQDMVGDLMDKEEDLTDQMESLASKFADSLDKGAGWDAADGPISNMSAQGVTGNQLPKNNEIQGRSGEGREGQASGEMVGSTAEGKEGRRTPTRMTPEPFSNSQVDDKSKLPEGGATGGGKRAGVGGEGLEGPGPAQAPDITQRLTGQQAAIRNDAERLSLQMNATGFDNFKLMESNAYLKKSEDALWQFHYQTALYYQEQAVQSLNTAKVLAAGQIHVIADSSPTASEKTRKDIDSALNGPMPKGYSDPVKAYFEKLASDKPNSGQ